MTNKMAASCFVRHVVVSLLVFFSSALPAQEVAQFDPIAASSELDDIAKQLDLESVDPEFLTVARARTTQIGVEAQACAIGSTEERARLEARFEPLRDVDADVAPSVFDQRNEILRLLDEATALQASCTGLRDTTTALVTRIVEIQNKLSQQFLSNRANSVIVTIQTFPDRVRLWPEQIRSANKLDLIDGITPVYLFWLLIGGGTLAAGIGLVLRYRFKRWFNAAGGDDAEPQMRYLFPRPLAEYSAERSGLQVGDIIVKVSGRPQVLLMLERLAEYISSHDGVRFLTFNEIADDFLTNHPREKDQ